MNVLLAEADVPYEQLKEMDVVNPDFPATDVVLVLGANDVVNPQAKNDSSSPLYGMPVLDVQEARTVFVIKRGMNAGYSGIKNDLFDLPNTSMVFGDAKKVLNDLIVDAIQDNKGKEIILYDLRQLEDASSDFFIICHGTSSTQIAGILKNIERRVHEELGIRPSHLEGKQGTWMLIDYFSVIVHIFSEEKREFYQLDDLWSDALVTTYES